VNTTTNSDVKINVYDVTGKKVETVKDEMMTAGQHEIVWAPENLSEGVYFVQMEIEGQVYTKKIVHTSNQ
jgi:flagellar hook assembly protein FlgD